MAQPTFEGPDGKPIVPKVTEDGEVRVTSTGTDGADLATEETLATLAGTVRTGTPLEDDTVIGVALKAGGQVIATIAAGQTATATPAPDAERIVVGVVDLAPAIPVGEAGTANPVTVLGTAQISGEVSQGRGLPPDTSDPWIVKTSDGVDAKEIATKEGQDAIEAAIGPKATTADVQEVRDAVDDLEVDADATRIAAEDLNNKTLSPLGTAFDPGRGTATNVAAQLPDIPTPRGFTLENIDDANYLYVDDTAAVTTLTGFRISPSRSRFYDLPNTNLLWVISSSTTAWQIGAVS